jgi:hypothetical protein
MDDADISGRIAAARARGDTVYLLFDGAYPGMRGIVYSHCGNPVWKPLWLGTPYEHMLDLSPGLISLDGEDKLLHWYISEGARSDAGALVASPQSLEIVAAHFQTYLEVVLPDSQGRVSLFRFFSPRVLEEYLPSLTPSEAAAFLSPCSVLWWPQTEPGETVQWREITNNGLAPAAGEQQWHYGFRLLSEQSLTALTGASSRNFASGLKKDVLRAYPTLFRLITEQGFDDYLQLHFDECEQAGISAKPRNVERSLWMRMAYGWHFWDELQFMRGSRSVYEATPLSREALNAAMPLLAMFVRDVVGAGQEDTNRGEEMRREAAWKVRPLAFSVRPEGLGLDGIADVLDSVYPQRTHFMGDAKTEALALMAMRRAGMMRVPEGTGGLCCALIFLFFGMGAFEDPLLQQWLTRLFAPPQGPMTGAKWGTDLLQRCCADICEFGRLLA